MARAQDHHKSLYSESSRHGVGNELLLVALQQLSGSSTAIPDDLQRCVTAALPIEEDVLAECLRYCLKGVENRLSRSGIEDAVKVAEAGLGLVSDGRYCDWTDEQGKVLAARFSEVTSKAGLLAIQYFKVSSATVEAALKTGKMLEQLKDLVLNPFEHAGF